MPKQTVNAAITAFYKSGWIRLEELPEDRRNKTIHFTDAGLKETEKILSKIRESEENSMKALSDEEHRILLSETKRYIRGCKIKG